MLMSISMRCGLPLQGARACPERAGQIRQLSTYTYAYTYGNGRLIKVEWNYYPEDPRTMDVSSGAPLLARREELRARLRALDEQLSSLDAQRTQCAKEIGDLDIQLRPSRGSAAVAAASIAGARAGVSIVGDGAGRRRRRACAQMPACRCLPARAEAVALPHRCRGRRAAQRASGELLPFGAAGRVPRVYVDGCFDMMHSGHMNAVRQAKLIADSVGGVLVVGVHTDAEIERNKGPPVMRGRGADLADGGGEVGGRADLRHAVTMSLDFLDSIDAEYVVHGDDISINADGTDGRTPPRGRLDA